MKIVVGGHPRHVFLPRQNRQRTRVGDTGNLVVVRFLSQAIERVAGVKFRTFHHVFEMRYRDDFGFGHAVNIDVAAHDIANARVFELGTKFCVILIHNFPEMMRRWCSANPERQRRALRENAMRLLCRARR